MAPMYRYMYCVQYVYTVHVCRKYVYFIIYVCPGQNVTFESIAPGFSCSIDRRDNRYTRRADLIVLRL